MSTTAQVKNSTKHIQLICVTGLFAAMIYVLTAWLHIPTGAGYTHAGDGLIYLAASMLPTPYAMAAGARPARFAMFIVCKVPEPLDFSFMTPIRREE